MRPCVLMGSPGRSGISEANLANEIAGSLRVDYITQSYSDYPAGSTFQAAPNQSVPIFGHRMGSRIISSVYHVFRLANSATLATGLTFNLILSLPVNAKNADITGSKAYFDITVAGLTSGTSLVDDSVFSSYNPTSAQITMPTVAGTVVSQDIAVTASGNAINGLSPGGVGMIRVRRNGSSALDTNIGDVLLLSMDVRNT